MKKFVVLLVSLTMLFSLASCSKQTDEAATPDDSEVIVDESTSEGEPDVNTEIEYSDVAFQEEDEDATIRKTSSDVSKYYGTWESTSGKAEYLYGGIEVTVNKDETWKAIIADEEFKGTWSDHKNYLRMNNDIFSFSLSFSDTGNMIFIDDEDGETDIVLTKK